MKKIYLMALFTGWMMAEFAKESLFSSAALSNEVQPDSARVIRAKHEMHMDFFMVVFFISVFFLDIFA